MMKRKILIDMDIGDDIDDAIALYAAMRRGLEIVGVTTVFRNVGQRARIAKRMLLEYGHGYERVPVYAGYGEQIDGWGASVSSDVPHYSSELDDARYAPDGALPEDAVDFIIDACHRYGEELTVIAIGPFTNLAKVIEKDADALNRVDRVIIMGGAFYKQYADWNVLCDVAAADLLFRSVDRLECLGADVTHQAVGERALYDNLLDYRGCEPCHRYLSRLCELWRIDRPKARFLLHDPLVIYYLCEPELCTMQPASVVVMTDGYARGMTLNVDAYGKRRFHPEIYAGFDDQRKASVAKAADYATFNRMILDDFSV